MCGCIATVCSDVPACSVLKSRGESATGLHGPSIAMPHVGIYSRHMHTHSVMATHVYTSTLCMAHECGMCIHASTLWLTSAACVYIHPLAHGCSMCTHPPSRPRAFHAAYSIAPCKPTVHISEHTCTHVAWCMHLTYRRVAGFANRMKTSSAAAALATAALGSSFSINPRCTAVWNGGSVGGGGVGGASASVDCDVAEMTTTAPTTHTHPKHAVTQAC
jgi:hypothetical protein